MERPKTPDRPIVRREATTSKRARFFTLVDERDPEISITALAKKEGIAKATAFNWLRLRRIKGSEATRRPGKNRSGRPRKLTDAQLSFLISPTRNPIRNRKLEHQATFNHLNVSALTLQRNLRLRKDTGMYDQRIIANLEPHVKQARIEWAKKLKNETIESYWQHVHFTDEKHFQMEKTRRSKILRKRSEALLPYNMKKK